MPPSNGRRSDAEIHARQHEMNRAVRDLPLEDVAERFLGLTPKEVTRTHRIYHVGDSLLNIDLRKQSWGFLNGIKLQCLRGRGGSTANAIDLVAGVREVSGHPVQFMALREELRQWASIPAPTGPITPRPAAPIQKREPTPEKRCVLPAEDPSLWDQVRAFLVEQRKLAPEIVDAAHDLGLIYPTLQTPAPGSKGRPHPAVVFVAQGPESGQAVSFQTKPLPQGTYKPKGLSGPDIGTGLFTIGSLTDTTTSIVVVEGPIDALAYVQLHGDTLPASALVVATFGVRTPTRLMDVCKSRGIQPLWTFAMDGDPPGWRGVRKAQESAQEMGFMSKPHRVADEAEWALSLDAKEAEDSFADLRSTTLQALSLCNCGWAIDSDNASGLSVRLQACEEGLAVVDKIEASARAVKAALWQRMSGASPDGAPKDPALKPPKILRSNCTVKDWNDLLMGAVRAPRLKRARADLAVVRGEPGCWYLRGGTHWFDLGVSPEQAVELEERLSIGMESLSVEAHGRHYTALDPCFRAATIYRREHAPSLPPPPSHEDGGHDYDPEEEPHLPHADPTGEENGPRVMPE